MLTSDLLVFPSEWAEGQPVVLLKATAQGLPILCADVPNYSAPLVRAGAATTFDAGSAASLGRRLHELRHRPDDVRQLSRAGRSLWEREFTPAVALSRLETIYAEVIGAGRPA
jgi:glycosyltransferase involved in cell wall biosynthesis